MLCLFKLLPLLGASLIYLCGCAAARQQTADTKGFSPSAETSREATLAHRQAAWTGSHHVYYAYLQYGGENEVSKNLILSPTIPPVFQSWSETATRLTPSSTTRNHAAIPGEVSTTRASDLSGGVENTQHQSHNKLVKAIFDPDYTTLTLHYRNSAFDGLLKRSFRLDESSQPSVIVGDEGSIYTSKP
jgi:hypothetical protein